MPRVGVLALQGDVREHVGALQALHLEPILVKSVRELDQVEGIVIPGGESTTIAYLLTTSGLRAPLGERLRSGMPALGTCAGLIMLASHIESGRSDQWSYSALDVTVRRNGYGRQIASFEAQLRGPNSEHIPGVFIRAPRIVTVGQSVETVVSYNHGDGEHPVLVRQNAVWGCSFHPELTDDLSIHRFFVESIPVG
jgi:pyridoxal 5'-phosphate synthase pdxT subunit